MSIEVAEKYYTIKEYLSFEQRAVNKHEYYNGKIIKMSGGTFNHNLIANNVSGELSVALRSKSFFVLNSDMKIRIPQFDCFVYPDAVVVFEKPIFYEDRTDVIMNPLLIVEVSSRSTRKSDRTTKFEYYKTLPSFKEYVLIEQTTPWAVASYKIAERTWQDTEVASLTGSLYLQSINYMLEMKHVYHGIEFRKPL